MNDLERYIKERREEFYREEPSEGHLEKFISLLPREKMKSIEFLKIAAIIIAAAFISVASYIFLGINGNKEIIKLMSSEVQETIYYYRSLNREKEKQIMSIPIDDRLEKSRIQNDIENYDEPYNQLMNDLKKYPNDERVINAIIEYHRSKSDMLEHILYQLNQKDV